MNDIPAICGVCSKRMTDEEYENYIFRCEQCERDWHDRVDAWRKGSPDNELDDLYDRLSIKPIIH